MKRIYSLAAIGGLALAFSAPASGHSGGTDSYGGHHCWTRCASKGYSYGEYHCHRYTRACARSDARHRRHGH